MEFDQRSGLAEKNHAGELSAAKEEWRFDHQWSLFWVKDNALGMFGGTLSTDMHGFLRKWRIVTEQFFEQGYNIRF